MNRKQRKLLVRIIIAGIMMIVLHFLPVEGPVRFGLYALPYLIVGYDILRKAWRGICNRQVFDENFLMAIATLGAMALGLLDTGDYVEAIMVMLFYQIGELFQSYAVGKSRRSIAKLMDIRPDFANIETEDGSIEKVDPETVAVGTVILVQPGERIPIDGTVTDGCSSLNTSALTGESLPRDVEPGDAVISGCINLTGVLRVRTTKPFGESTVSRVLEMVENASSRKSRAEHFISRFARVYTPAVCGAALALAVLPPVASLLSGVSPDWPQWLYRALTFLVASCPCALVISIPLTFFAGIGGAGKEGILVKGSNYLEALSKAECIVFDKTGTLTQGVFEVCAVHAASGFSEAQLLEFAALAECASTHPIGISLRRAWGRPVDMNRVTQLQEHGGMGITAMVDGKNVAVGNHKLMDHLSIQWTAPEAIGTVVLVSIDGCYAGGIIISDLPKPNASNAVAELGKIGIRQTVMLTGDNEATAAQVARTLGIRKYEAGLLPGDKVDRVESLMAQKQQGRTLAFVGDGINDAPVLSRADIGIAMGAMGSDAAIEAADIVLMDDDPMKLPKAIRICKKCLGIVWQNTVFAIGVKLLALLLVALGVAGMGLAIFADVGVMVLAVLNAIRALFVKKL